MEMGFSEPPTALETDEHAEEGGGEEGGLEIGRDKRALSDAKSDVSDILEGGL